MKLLSRLAAIGAAATIALVGAPGIASAAPTLSLVSLNAAVSGNSVTVTTEVSANPTTTLDRIGVCVRSSSGANLDYPQATNVVASPTVPAKFTATKTFANGTFTYRACVYEAGVWYNVGASKTFTTPGATTPPPTTTPGTLPSNHPAYNKPVAFGDEFDTLSLGSRWGYSTTAYQYGTRNPNYYKRDYVTPAAMKIENGQMVMTATQRDSFYWNTGLLTTEPSSTGGNGFRVKAGDFVVNRVMLPVGNTGAWPGLWTWDGPDAEVDVFEWHSDNPDLLEFTTHLRDDSPNHYHTDANLIGPGKYVWIGTKLGATNNTWYVGSTLENMQPIWSDGVGMGTTQPYLIANLSLNSGPYHTSPSSTGGPITYKIDSVRVYR